MTNEELYYICECYNVDFSDYITIKEYIKSLEQQNTALQARIKELEERKTCATCKYWYKKSCSNNDGIAYNGTNAVYEDDYCKDYEQKQN